MIRSSLVVLAAVLLAPGSVRAARSYDNCTGFIDSLPAEISTQGTWCLRKDLATAVGQGRMLQVSSNNVTIDCNDFKIGNLQAGTDTIAYGIYSTGTFNVSVRNCNVRGFARAIYLSAYPSGGNYLVENNRVQGATLSGLYVQGAGSVVRGNTVSDIGGTTRQSDSPVAIIAGDAVDIMDNTISRIEGALGATGLYVMNAAGASVTGNRIRQVVSANPEQVYGIRTNNSFGMVIRDNDILGAGGLHGIKCSSSAGWDRVRGNTVVGFTAALDACGDAGGNHTSP